MLWHKQQSSPVIWGKVTFTHICMAGTVISAKLGKEDYSWGQACQDVAPSSQHVRSRTLAALSALGFHHLLVLSSWNIAVLHGQEIAACALN